MYTKCVVARWVEHTAAMLTLGPQAAQIDVVVRRTSRHNQSKYIFHHCPWNVRSGSLPISDRQAGSRGWEYIRAESQGNDSCQKTLVVEAYSSSSERVEQCRSTRSSRYISVDTTLPDHNACKNTSDRKKPGKARSAHLRFHFLFV